MDVGTANGTASVTGVLDDAASAHERRAAMARRRDQCPVARVEPDTDGSPWYLASYRAVAAVLPDVLRLGGAAGAGDVEEDLQSFNGFLEPRHGQVRRVVNGLVAAHRAREAEPFIRQRCRELVGKVAGRAGGGATIDVMEALVDPLPCAVIAWLLGWPTDDPVQLYRWTVTLCDRAMEMSPGAALSSADLCPDFAAYVDGRIDERLATARGQWPDDGLTHMLTAEIDGVPVSRTMVRTQLMFLLGAGSETTRDLIGGLLHDLAGDPDLYRRVRDDRALVPAAVEEALRLWSPTQFMIRRCLAPLAVDDQPIGTGDVVTIGLASANRDEAVFAHADRFDVDRSNLRSHLAFGSGPHVCPGAALARTEAQLCLNAFLDRFSEATLVPGGTDYVGSAMFSGPKRLAVRLTVEVDAPG